MQGYLLDTNILRFWHDSNRAEHPFVMQRIAELPEDAPLMISVISLGEIEYGHRLLGKAGDAEQEAAFLGLIESRFPTPLPVSKHTRTSYGSLRASFSRSSRPKSCARRTGARNSSRIPPPVMSSASTKTISGSPLRRWSTTCCS